MKTIVITGGTRGIGRELALEFLKKEYKVVVSGTRESTINAAKSYFSSAGFSDQISAFQCNVSNPEEIIGLWESAEAFLGRVDIWINNAGINQPDKPVAKLEAGDIDTVLSVDLNGTIQATRIVFNNMSKQGGGYIYNMEGFGSDDRTRTGLSIYGTAKRAVTYFTKAFIHETTGSPVKTCFLSPGMVLTDFLLKPLRDNPEQAEKLEHIYTILADLPEVVTPYLAEKIDKNTKHGAKIAWLTSGKVMLRFLTGGRRKNKPDIGKLI
ncbi:MAG: SDR family oxidoreductase [Bacteroidetes bacterium]|nr:SDR family oxidoreductase [Bacteroidota bacterium]